MSNKPTAEAAGRYSCSRAKIISWLGKSLRSQTCPFPPINSFQAHGENEIGKFFPAHGQDYQRSDRRRSN